jgi:hypothetical protein
MGLSGPIRTIAVSAQRAHPACDRNIPWIGHDLTLHAHTRNEEVR